MGHKFVCALRYSSFFYIIYQPFLIANSFLYLKLLIRSDMFYLKLIFPITKTRLFKYIENFTAKKRKVFRYLILMFHIPAQNIDCGYSSEPPRRGGSNEYPQSMFLSRNKKNNVYPCKLQLYYIKVGLRGSKLYRHVFMMPILNACALAMVMVWWFMSPLALFKSYRDNEGWHWNNLCNETADVCF